MRPLSAVSLSLLLLVMAAAVSQPLLASPRVEAATLAPTAAHARASVLAVRVLERLHYRRVAVDDVLSERVLERYLDALDPGRSFLMRADVDAFEQRYRHSLDDALRAGQLAPAFEIFKVLRSRTEERSVFASGLLETQFDFTRPESYPVDRADAPWASNRAELDDLWRRRVKNDLLSLRLSGKEDAEAVEVLRGRYEQLGRRVLQLNADDVVQIFLNAYTAAVEPHTAYLSPRTSENFRIRLNLSLEGIGAALQTEGEYTVVRRVIPGGPAERSGQLKADDRVVGVAQGDGAMVDVVGWRLDDVVDLIRGPKDSLVRLEVLGAGSDSAGPRRELALVRSEIRLEEQAPKRSVVERSVDGERVRVGVIRVPTFYSDGSGRSADGADARSTTHDVRRLIGELRAEGIDGLIVDLRGDGGGALSEAIDLTGLFIDKGPVVQVKDAAGSIEVLEDTNRGVAYAGPLLVMVDRQSASASEIFAGAIQDYRAGLLVGEPTFGKGTVQSLLDLDRFVRGSDDSLGQLKTTVAQFFRVTGDSTQHRGVVPDITFPTAAYAEEEGERAFENALPWGRVAPARHAPASALSATLLNELRHRHAQRAREDDALLVLLEEAEALRTAQGRKQVTLVEEQRLAERAAEKRAQEDRERRLRAALGLPETTAIVVSRAESEEEEGVADDQADAWLQEATRIIADWVFIERSAAAPRVRSARATGDGRRSAELAVSP